MGTKWWMSKVIESNPECVFILVGTKEDLVTEATPDLQPIRQWAEREGIPFFPTTAKEGGGKIDFLFHAAADKCVKIDLKRRLMRGQATPTLKLDVGDRQSKLCC